MEPADYDAWYHSARGRWIGDREFQLIDTQLRAAHGSQALPFEDRQFDHAVAITSFCFIADQARALTEWLRVTRGRIALGLLNRHSLLYARKGRHGGSGAYRSAHWHTVGDVRTLFAQCGLTLRAVRSAIHLPDAGLGARLVEYIAGPRLPTGAFLLALGTVE